MSKNIHITKAELRLVNGLAASIARESASVSSVSQSAGCQSPEGNLERCVGNVVGNY